MTLSLPDRRPHFNRLLRATLLTGVIDGLWAVVLTRIYGRTVMRLWQGVAATAFGQGMFDGGIPTMLLGIATHFTVAFTWSAIFLLLFTRSAWLRRVLDSPAGLLAVAAVYGPLIWIVMSAIVIPTLSGTPFKITGRWVIQAAGHMVFVGLPIVWSIARPRVSEP